MVYSDVFEKIASLNLRVSIFTNNGERRDFYEFDFRELRKVDLFCEKIIFNLYFLDLNLDAKVTEFTTNSYFNLFALVDGYDTIINRLSIWLDCQSDSVYDDICKTCVYTGDVFTFRIRDIKVKES